MVCFICFWINIGLAAGSFVYGTGFVSIAFSLACAGLCLASYLQK